VCGVNTVFYQQIVEPMLGSGWYTVWHLEAELAETGSPDRYEQGRDGLATLAQVLQAFINNIATRQSCAHFAYFNASEPSAANGPINFCVRLISG